MKDGSRVLTSAMKGVRENFFVQFSVASLAVLTAVAVAIALLMSGEIQSHAIGTAVDDAIARNSGLLASSITPADLDTPMTGERYDRFHTFVTRYMVSGRTAKVKLWAPDGTVVYSSDAALVGERFPGNEKVAQALRGENVAAVPSAEQLAKMESERFSQPMIEVYTPIVFPGSSERLGVFEIYEYYRPTANLIRELRRDLLMSVGAGFVVLYGLLVGIVWGGWKALVRQRKEKEQVGREKEEIQGRLLQAQKMEAVGRLAGGVAHDFNNLLTVITVCSDALLNDLGDNGPSRQDAIEIKKAAERAAILTKQLLAFSRKQVSQPEVLNLNLVAADLEKMLRRLVGEDCQLESVLQPELLPVFADRGGIEQIIVNLVVNARDAMPNGGRITIRTENLTLVERDSAAIPGARPGPFVRLSVSDTGAGMSKETLSHLFEPFFTTKGPGRGTGLGLATVWGIVQQDGGWVTVYSDLGRGSTFKVYLPIPADLSGGRPRAASDPAALQRTKGSGERILLVEDEQPILALAQRLLRENGYSVLAAGSVGEAIDVFTREDDVFHLVVSDVVLPDGSGAELATRLLSLNPRLGVIMTSGYADEKSQFSLIHDKGYAFIQKPYTADRLLGKVSEILAAARRKSPGQEDPQLRCGAFGELT